MKKVDKEKLHELYVVEGKPMHQVASEMNLSVGCVYNNLHKYGIPTRQPHQGMKGKKLSEDAKARISKCHKGKVVSKETRAKMSNALKKGGIGHKKKRSDGYISIYFPDHPKSTADGFIMEHVLVMECIIGRHLKDDEVVHHKNGIRHDNRKENLQLLTFKEHAAYHMRERHAKKKGGMTYQ